MHICTLACPTYWVHLFCSDIYASQALHFELNSLCTLYHYHFPSLELIDFSLSQQPLTFSSTCGTKGIFLFMVACQLLLTSCQSCSGKHTVEISWARFPCYICRTLSRRRYPGPLSFCNLSSHFSVIFPEPSV